MGGVDVADANWQRFHIGFKKMRRWYMNHMFFIIDACIENARIIHNAATGKKMSSRAFRVELYYAWSGMDREAMRKEIRMERGFIKPSTAGHSLIKTSQFVERTPNEQSYTTCRRVRQTCKQCSNEKRRTDTVWRCKKCKPEVALCDTKCFDKYHKKLNKNHAKRKRKR